MRRIIAAIVALAVTVVLPVMAPQTAQAASKKTKVTISVSATKLSQGKYLTIKGKVRPAVAGRPVVLQHKMDGAGWKNEVKLTTAADGSYSSTGQINKLQNRYYRVYAPKFQKYKKAYSKAIYVRVTAPVRQASSVRISSAPTSVVAGDRFTVSGVASNNLIGKSVVLQAMTVENGAWDVSSARVAGDGTFSIAGSIASAGAGQTLTVYAPSTPTTLYSISDPASLSVYGWYYLNEQTFLDNDGAWYSESVTINGKTYASSVADVMWFDDTESVQFDLGRKCTRFSATAGWSDTANSAVTGNAAAFKDNVQLWGKTAIPLGVSTDIDADITGALRLKLQNKRTGGARSDFAFGDARILCAF